MKLPCKKCKSTDGEYKTFYYHSGTYYYWVCICGMNHGHGSSKEAADKTWNEFNKK